MPKNRTARTLLGLGLALVFLGAGNLIVGAVNQAEYLQLLSAAQAELTTPEKPLDVPLAAQAPGINAQLQHIQRIKARLEFYEVVRLGGKCLLGAAALFLLGALISFKQEA